MRDFLGFLFGVAAAAACFGLLLLHVPCPRGLLPAQQGLIILGRSTTNGTNADPTPSTKKPGIAPAPAPGDDKLEALLRRASMADLDKTVILTFASQAWTAPGSLQDLLLQSFRLGVGTEPLLKHLVIVADGAKAYEQCQLVHPLCYHLEAGGVDYAAQQSYMAKGYLEIVWRKFLSQARVLNLGYSFVFTDMDIIWLRNPLLRIPIGADLAMSCDKYYGDNPYDLDKLANTGFMYVKASPRMVAFYESWYKARLSYRYTHEQYVFQQVKDKLPAQHGIRVQFVDTAYFTGFCQLRKDFNKVCTVHANCLVGLKSKQEKLTQVLDEWKEFKKKAALLGSNTTTALTH
ncbi:Regulatory protein [Zea mays]|nr:Regulatory protein [Zea mays]